MENPDLKKEIDALKMLVEAEEVNYKNALPKNIPFDALKQMRTNIKKLNMDLQILLDKESVSKTGELPDKTREKE
jgi:hypothetical protein